MYLRMLYLLIYCSDKAAAQNAVAFPHALRIFFFSSFVVVVAESAVVSRGYFYPGLLLLPSLPPTAFETSQAERERK